MAMMMLDKDIHRLVETACDQSVQEEAYQKLIKHLELVLEKNNQLNITAITDFCEAVYLHLLDSLLATSLIENEPLGQLCDMGSGNGFPGISLSIVTERETLLIESTKKKARLIAEIIQSLDLDRQVRILDERIETASLGLKESYQIVTARALAPLSVLLELSNPLLRIGGVLIAYKGEMKKEELDAAIKLEKKLGMTFEQIVKKEIPGNGIARNLIMFKKQDEAEIKLPRGVGLAQKRPLMA